MKEDRLTFFRQGSWITIAAIISGVFMFLAGSVIAQRYLPKDPITGESQFGVMGALLAAIAQMGIPALGLQTVFAQQAGAAHDERLKRQLAGTIRSVATALFVLWLLLVLLAQVFERDLLAAYKIENPAALWFTVDAALISMLSPIFTGLLQGRQDFVWFGWISIFNGASRCVAMFILIVLLHFQAAGAMAGILFGLLASLALYMWRTKPAWSGETVPFEWGEWLRRVLPLTLGLGAFTFVMTRDPIIVQRAFGAFGKTSEYMAARQVGAALIFLTTPLAAVMFAKVARSHALSQKNNVLLQALGATAIVGGLGALVCTVLPELPLRLMAGTKFIEAAPLVPWFCWCMLPLIVANILINNLFAQKRFGIVPWLVAVAVGYDVTLRFLHGRFVQVIQILGVFGLLLVAVCVVFTLKSPQQEPPGTR